MFFTCVPLVPHLRLGSPNGSTTSNNATRNQNSSQLFYVSFRNSFRLGFISFYFDKDRQRDGKTESERGGQTDGLSSRMSMHPLRSPTKNLFCFSRLCLPFLLLLLVFYFSRRRRRRRRWWLALNNDDKRAELHRALSTCEYIRIDILTLALGLSLSSIHLPVVLFLIIDLLWHLFCLYLVCVFFCPNSSPGTREIVTVNKRYTDRARQRQGECISAACRYI